MTETINNDTSIDAILLVSPNCAESNCYVTTFQGNALGHLHTSQENRLCQDAQDSLQYGAEHTAAVRPHQQRRVPAAVGQQLLGQHAQALHRRADGQGRPDEGALAQDTAEEPGRL